VDGRKNPERFGVIRHFKLEMARRRKASEDSNTKRPARQRCCQCVILAEPVNNEATQFKSLSDSTERRVGDGELILIPHVHACRSTKLPAMAVDRECDPDASRNLRREVLHSYAKMLPLPRRHGLSVSQFEREHLATSQPVVLADALRGWPAIEWSLDHIEARCGQRPLVPRCHDGRREHEYPARLRRFNDSLIGHEWVAMQELSPAEAGVETVGELVRRLRSADGDGLYLHDQSIGSLCPLLLDDVRAPRWFPVDLKLQVPALNQCDPLHPSIFVGRDGTRSGFHVDSDATRFWMVVLRGSKRFRLYAPVVHGRQWQPQLGR